MSALDFEHSGRTRIVVGDHEFPSVGQIAHAQALRGAEVVHVHPADDGSIPTERFAEAIDDATAIVCCATVSYRTGHRQDIGEIARIAHEHGALCLADSYQGLGAIDIDAPALGVDVITGGTVKYLLASAGLGFAYVRSEALERLVPTQTGWFADENIFAMDITDYSPAPDARKFEAGTPPVPNIYAGVAGAAIIEETGTAAIERHVDGLGTRLIDGLEELGGDVVTPRASHERGPLICVRSSDVDTLVRELADDRIVASSRDGNLRIALHLYNTEEDIDAVLTALETRRSLLA
jgi:selenocysteine lyase/cysteine desulfurase